jgi:hypothetical protein
MAGRVNSSAFIQAQGQVGFPAIRPGRMPFVLVPPKDSDMNVSGEIACGFCLGVLKIDLGGDERMPFLVFVGACGGKHGMRSTIVLQPFEVDHPAGKILREGLLDLKVRVQRKHAERPWRIIAIVLHLQREIVKIVDAAATRIQE